MGVVEPDNGWDANPNRIPGDEDFGNILNILDFPMESLEDDGFVDDWDIANSICLGPVPSAVPMGPPTDPNVKVECSPPYLASEVIAPTAGTLEQKLPLDLVNGASGPRMILPNKSPEAQESSVFRTQSPISVLESSGSCSAGKILPNSIPVRTRSKRVKRPNSWISASSCFTSTPRKDKNMKRKLQGPRANEIENPSQVPNCPAVTKRCTHCEVTKTPQWREGPLGPKTLCNACGVRYRSGRLFPEYRPAASPTFVPALHSNSHKKVVEMRTKGKGQMIEIEECSTSPQPEFVPMSNYLFDYIY